MEQTQGTIDYHHEFSTLIRLIQSNTPQSERVIKVLKTGDEKLIRHMLTNFGNPEDPDWSDITMATPWADWQINQAIQDGLTVKPPVQAALSFWIW